MIHLNMLRITQYPSPRVVGIPITSCKKRAFRCMGFQPRAEKDTVLCVTCSNESLCPVLCTIISSWVSKVGCMLCLYFFYQLFFNPCWCNFVWYVFLFWIANFPQGGIIRDTNTVVPFCLRLIGILKEGKFNSASVRIHEVERSQTRLTRKQVINIKGV